MQETKNIIHKHHLQNHIKVLQFPWHVSLAYFDQQGNNSWELRTLFHQEMIKRAVLFQGLFFPQKYNKKKNIEQILNDFDESFDVFKKALEDGVEKYLVGEPIKPVFRKYI
jgi:hypothetical protein